MKQASQRRVQAVVALKLLEVIRDRDLPGELLEDEDPTVTIPRRFGLSDVVERQIRTFREEARRGGKLSDREIGDLFRLVLRRPDGDKVFHEAGRLLADEEASGRWPRALPAKARFSVARSRSGKRLRRLFGRPTGRFESGGFVLEAREHFLIDTDPGGGACHLVSGLCEQILAHTIGGTPVVSHTECRSLGDETCRWEGVLEAPPATVELAEEWPDEPEWDAEDDDVRAAEEPTMPAEQRFDLDPRPAETAGGDPVGGEAALAEAAQEDRTDGEAALAEAPPDTMDGEPAVDAAAPADGLDREAAMDDAAAAERLTPFGGAGVLVRDGSDEADAGAGEEAPRIP